MTVFDLLRVVEDGQQRRLVPELQTRSRSQLCAPLPRPDAEQLQVGGQGEKCTIKMRSILTIITEPDKNEVNSGA